MAKPVVAAHRPHGPWAAGWDYSHWQPGGTTAWQPAYTHAYAHVYTHAHTHAYTHAYAHAYTHAHTHVYAHVSRLCPVNTVPFSIPSNYKYRAPIDSVHL